MAFLPPWLVSVAVVAGVVAGFLAHHAGQCFPAPSIRVPVHAARGWLVCPLAQAGFILSCLQRGHPAGCTCMCQYQLVTSVNSTAFVCPCCSAGHLGWHPEPRAGLQVSHHHCSLGTTHQAEERYVAEPGSSSDKWEHSGKVFGFLGDLLPGGEIALGSGIDSSEG